MKANKPVNLSASLEDYLEAIFNLSSEQSVARSKDIAQTLDVSRASVTGALKTLSEKALINYKPYGYITLTPSGAKAAQKVVRRHNIIKSFFTDILGVEEVAAQEAACKAEHALGHEIVMKLLNFIEFVSRNNSTGKDLAGQFSTFCKNNQKKWPTDDDLEIRKQLKSME